MSCLPEFYVLQRLAEREERTLPRSEDASFRRKAESPREDAAPSATKQRPSRVVPFLVVVAALASAGCGGAAPSGPPTGGERADSAAYLSPPGVVRYLDVTFKDVPDTGTKGRRVRYVCAPEVVR